MVIVAVAVGSMVDVIRISVALLVICGDDVWVFGKNDEGVIVVSVVMELEIGWVWLHAAATALTSNKYMNALLLHIRILFISNNIDHFTAFPAKL